MTDNAASEASERNPAAPLAGSATAVEPVPDRVPVDTIDLQILRLLALDSRASQRALARALGMSAPAIGERIARLERLGVIRNYTITVDWARLGYSMEVFLDILAVTGADIGELIRELIALPEVVSVDSVSGAFDLTARLRVRDHQHLSRIMVNWIWQMPLIQRTETSFSFASGVQRNYAAKLLGFIQEQYERAAASKRSGAARQ